ncbi:peptidoglycan DD-metalloendopeptidase family protein [Altererythrobacter aurantiacus]|uniref:Peptidoglycan DD-metalloendopeptidase family protein n=1 Tax=Parapontixanthobacter aurantiacus TaxID=1463599 RepID=A0A844ZGC4_9SPHN|nr:M23 family metallopeptidase [Parapontixanthobacter aurantiacus]MXO86905.1 peptidoglycan DD-metalloendopeptidase family protein [Parapontixanthobacter aurantiacus]
MRRAAMLGLAGLCAACVPSPQADSRNSANPAQDREVVEPIAVEQVLPEPEPEPAGPTTFVYDGELTQGGWIRGQAPAGTRSARLGEQELTLDAKGRFFAAFDRDQGPAIRLVATRADGKTIESPIAVSPRDWNIEHVDLARNISNPSQAFLDRRRPELEAIGTARANETGSEGWRQDFVWPVKGRISGRFGSQRYYRGEAGSYHSGIDIAPGAGVAYVAPADGVVTLAREGFSLEGGLIIMDHGQGLNSAFLHSSRLLVSEGQRVKQGEPLGLVGDTGSARGAHLHWSLKWKDARLDPLLFTGPMD